VISAEGTPESLPVFTIGSMDRFSKNSNSNRAAVPPMVAIEWGNRKNGGIRHDRNK
jgi:hypothetical protein